MEQLRAENAVMRTEQASSAETQEKLQAENDRLQSQVQDHQSLIEDLSKQLSQMKEVMRTAGVSPAGLKRHVGLDMQAQVAEVVASFGRDGTTAVRSASTALGSSPAESPSDSLSEPGTPPSPASLFATPTQRTCVFNPVEGEDDAWQDTTCTWVLPPAEEIPVKRCWVQVDDPALYTDYGSSEQSPMVKNLRPLTTDGPEEVPKLMIVESTEETAAATDSPDASSTPIQMQLEHIKAQMAVVESQSASLRAATRAVEEEYKRVVTETTGAIPGGLDHSVCSITSSLPVAPTSGAPSLGLPSLRAFQEPHSFASRLNSALLGGASDPELTHY